MNGKKQTFLHLGKCIPNPSARILLIIVSMTLTNYWLFSVYGCQQNMNKMPYYLGN